MNSSMVEKESKYIFFSLSILLLPLCVVTTLSLWVSIYYLCENGYRHSTKINEMENQQAK